MESADFQTPKGFQAGVSLSSRNRHLLRRGKGVLVGTFLEVPGLAEKGGVLTTFPKFRGERGLAPRAKVFSNLDWMIFLSLTVGH